MANAASEEPVQHDAAMLDTMRAKPNGLDAVLTVLGAVCLISISSLAYVAGACGGALGSAALTILSKSLPDRLASTADELGGAGADLLSKAMQNLGTMPEALLWFCIGSIGLCEVTILALFCHHTSWHLTARFASTQLVFFAIATATWQHQLGLSVLGVAGVILYAGLLNEIAMRARASHLHVVGFCFMSILRLYGADIELTSTSKAAPSSPSASSTVQDPSSAATSLEPLPYPHRQSFLPRPLALASAVLKLLFFPDAHEATPQPHRAPTLPVIPAFQSLDISQLSVAHATLGGEEKEVITVRVTTAGEKDEGCGKVDETQGKEDEAAEGAQQQQQGGSSGRSDTGEGGGQASRRGVRLGDSPTALLAELERKVGG